MKKMLPPMLFLGCLVTAAVLFYFVPVAEIISFPVNTVGVVLVAAGITLLIVGSTLFQRVGTNINPFIKPDKLVIQGPFRFTRNPMYLGFVLTLLGACMLLGALSPFVTAVVFFVIVNSWYIPMEEAMCEEEFGENYKDYKRRVRRWL